MGVVSLSLPADGSTGTVSQYNTPLTTLQTEFNGNIDNNNIKAGAAIDSTKVTFATGFPIQIVSTNFSAVATGTTVIPYDDTIPQITEGTEFMTQAIIPKSVTNRLFIEAKIYASNTVIQEIIAALFQDASANALATQVVYGSTATGEVCLFVSHDMVAGTTSSTTFRIRMGGAAASTTTFNGRGGARKFGGVTLSTFKITEYRA
jgi:hypothetical protein